jgi:hypothetical protein
VFWSSTTLISHERYWTRKKGAVADIGAVMSTCGNKRCMYIKTMQIGWQTIRKAKAVSSAVRSLGLLSFLAKVASYDVWSLLGFRQNQEGSLVFAQLDKNIN